MLCFLLGTPTNEKCMKMARRKSNERWLLDISAHPNRSITRHQEVRGHWLQAGGNWNCAPMPQRFTGNAAWTGDYRQKQMPAIQIMQKNTFWRTCLMWWSFPCYAGSIQRWCNFNNVAAEGMFSSIHVSFKLNWKTHIVKKSDFITRLYDVLVIFEFEFQMKLYILTATPYMRLLLLSWNSMWVVHALSSATVFEGNWSIFEQQRCNWDNSAPFSFSDFHKPSSE